MFNWEIHVVIYRHQVGVDLFYETFLKMRFPSGALRSATKVVKNTSCYIAPYHSSHAMILVRLLNELKTSATVLAMDLKTQTRKVRLSIVPRPFLSFRSVFKAFLRKSKTYLHFKGYTHHLPQGNCLSKSFIVWPYIAMEVLYLFMHCNKPYLFFYWWHKESTITS